MLQRATGSKQLSRTVETATIVKLAERMLAASQVVARGLPIGFAPASPINFLLELFLAEEMGRCLSPDGIGRNDGLSERVVQRWIAALAMEGFVETSGQAVGLTDCGHQSVSDMLARLYESEQLLD